MNVEAYAISDQGLSRETNEDFVLVDESLNLFIVCDGIGGHAAGEVAAQQAAETAAEFVRRNKPTLENASKSPDGAFRALKLAEEATQQASRKLFAMGSTNPEYSGMGTTLTLLLIIDSKGIMAHVGDSRLYLVRSNELHQLSIDHTLANELLHEAGLTEMTEEIARYKNILTRSVGRQEMVQVDSLLFDLLPNDVCLLCTDGLSNYFEDSSTVVEMLKQRVFPLLPNHLVDIANEKGGKDNISLILTKVRTDSEHTDSQDVPGRLDALKSTFLCHNLSAGRLIRVLNIASTIECKAGQSLISIRQPCHGLYVLMEGKMLMEDDQILSSEMSPGDFFGASSLLCDSKSQVSLMAEEDSRLLFISKSEFSKLSRRFPKLGNVLLRNLGEYLSQQLDRLQTNAVNDLNDTVPWKPDK